MSDEGKDVREFDFKDIGAHSIIKTIKFGPHVSNYEDNDEIKKEFVEYIKTKLSWESDHESRVTSSTGRIQ
jgi:hypothetical protein